MPEEAKPTVRIFPDHADTVLWFDGPVSYEDTRLRSELVAELQAWDLSYYKALTPEFEWKSADLARRFTAEGNRLAQMLADELGQEYEVEFESYEPGAQARRFRSTGPALNKAAEAAFDRLRAEYIREQEAFAQLRAEGGIVVTGQD